MTFLLAALAHRSRTLLPVWRRSAFLVLALGLLVAPAAHAATVTGVVRNGTNGKPAAGVDVILIQLQGGMESVASTKTDGAGRYTLENPEVGQQAMLIRAIYRGVMFHQPLPPGHTTADVTVYDPTSKPGTLKVSTHLIVFQPNSSSLLVGEEYSLQNNTQPPLAYFNQKGDFEFQIPQGAQLSQVSSWDSSGMPVIQGTMDRGPSHYAIAYAFQPGDNGVRFSYEVPYPSNQTTVRFASEYSAARVLLIAPPSVQVNSPGFEQAGTEQGFNVYSRDSVPAGLPFDVSVSGTAPPPSQDQQGDGQDQVNGRDSGPPVEALPNRLNSLKWIVIAGFAMLFALGLVFLWRKPEPVPAAGVAGGVPAAASSGPRMRKQPTRAAIAGKSAPKPAADALAGIGSEVDRSLDALKDRLFRLELRRQAGTISEEEYARERSQTEQILRELVRG
jgi:hypothetical protein